MTRSKKNTGKKYNDAVANKNYGEANHNIKYLKRAADMFTELGGYKNSKILAYNTRKQIAIELERAKEQEEQEKEHATAVKGVIFVLGFVLLAVITLISINR